MAQTLDALSGILIKAIPTVLIIIFLHFYLKYMLFAPLRKVLKERDQLTAGARKAAEASLSAADRKAQEYEAKLNEARAEVYKQQEETRKQWLDDHAGQVAAVRERMQGKVKDGRSQISAETDSARQNLIANSGVLADQIADRILTRRAQEAA
ncbi:MAG: ATP synthase F0 subunit B [Bryobacterales bacterium]|nr:ATP synthase F0 subunit B [Bryobacterales bacterium]